MRLTNFRKSMPRCAREHRSIATTHIGIAVATGKGWSCRLPVPSGWFCRNREGIADFASRAQEEQAGAGRTRGRTFTITNGGYSARFVSTPIEPPQSAILGLHAIQDRPVAREGQVVIAR